MTYPLVLTSVAALLLTSGLTQSAFASGMAANLTTPIHNSSVVKYAQLGEAHTTPADFSIFTPRPQSSNIRIDYAAWDDALDNVVLDLGPSTRQRARRPDAQVGTRVIKGHKSAYRLEGSRFTFAYLNDDFKEGLSAYRAELEEVGSNYDITKFSRDEQLAYWLNLHNVAMIEQIALNYPIDQPSRIKIRVDGKKVPLGEAKFLTVKGQKLSLKNIRENIVYANWDNPNVIYGFFRGEIGGPALPRFAYASQDVNRFLTQNADEFVNSLRGFNLSSNSRNVSALYQEAAPYFFPNWEADIKAHLLSHANEETRTEVHMDRPIKIDRYDAMIADLSGGQRLGSSGLASSQNGAVPYEIARLLTEVRDKKQYLRRRGLLGTSRGYVIIEDLVPQQSAPPPTVQQEP